jgi:hypothetical protein
MERSFKLKRNERTTLPWTLFHLISKQLAFSVIETYTKVSNILMVPQILFIISYTFNIFGNFLQLPF